MDPDREGGRVAVREAPSAEAVAAPFTVLHRAPPRPAIESQIGHDGAPLWLGRTDSRLVKNVHHRAALPGGALGFATVDEMAAVLELTVEDVIKLVHEGALRALPLSGGGWVTSLRAVATYRQRHHRKAQLRRHRRRPTARSVPEHPSVPILIAATSIAAPAAPRTPNQTPDWTASRSVPIDTRPDVAHITRLDLAAAAAALGVTQAAALQEIRRGRLRATRLGREWVTTTRDLMTYRSTTAR